MVNEFESFARCNDKRIRFTLSEETIKFDDVEQMRNYIYGQYLLKQKEQNSIRLTDMEKW